MPILDTVANETILTDEDYAAMACNLLGDFSVRAAQEEKWRDAFCACRSAWYVYVQWTAIVNRSMLDAAILDEWMEMGKMNGEVNGEVN